MYSTTGVLTSLKSGRLIAQSRIIPRIARNKAMPRWIISIRGPRTGASEPAQESEKAYIYTAGREGGLREGLRATVGCARGP
jgi:hypothetical protein